MSNDELVVFSTHCMNESVAEELVRLRKCGRPVVVSSNVPIHAPNVMLFQPGLSALPYTTRSLWHNVEFQMILIRLHLPQFNRYWYVEYDVRYTGDWGRLMDLAAVRPDSFLGTYTGPRSAENVRWNWWNFAPRGCASLWRAFLPLWRISGEAIDLLDTRYRDGRTGYCEVAMPSLLKEAGMEIGELADCGIQYGRDTYTYLRKPRSITVDPARTDTLFHPVRTNDR